MVPAIPMHASLTQLKSVLTFWKRRAAKADEPPPLTPAPDAEGDTPNAAPPEAAADAPGTPRLLARIRALFRRRGSTDATHEAETAEIERPAAAVSETGDDDAHAPAAGPGARLVALLGRKRVWIPLTAVISLSAIGAVAYLLVAASQEQVRLRQELAAARAQLAEHHTPRPAPPATDPPGTGYATPPTPPRKTETAKQPDPAFEIVGSAQARERVAGVEAADCLVADRAQVAQHLKHCIDSFNAAMAKSTPRRTPSR